MRPDRRRRRLPGTRHLAGPPAAAPRPATIGPPDRDVRTPTATRRRPTAAPRRPRPAARRPEAGGRRARPRAASATRAAGRHSTWTAHWKREPGRLRRWLTPTSLTPSTQHLARADAGEAHQRAPVRARHAAAVHVGAGDAEVGERRGDVPAEPRHRRRHVVADARRVQVRGRHDDVEPHDAPRLEQHRAASAAASHDVDTGRRARREVGDVRGPLARTRRRAPGAATSNTHTSGADVVAEHPGVEVGGRAGGRCRRRTPSRRDGEVRLPRLRHARCTLTTTHAVAHAARGTVARGASPLRRACGRA